MQRRRFLAATATLTVPLLGAAPTLGAVAQIGALEARAGGRLGVFAVDTADGRAIEHRASERFPMCSTFKALAVGTVLDRVDRGRERLDRRIRYTSAALLDHSPVTQAHLREGSMTVVALCAATIEYSDNGAANLLLAALGGPAEVTRFARSIGDMQTRLDRTEPGLNSAIPGDPRDTTTPQAIATTLRALTLGTALSPASRARLHGWMLACTTGYERLRAGLPPGCLTADKTGSGSHGSTNDIAVITPPNRKPIVAAVYFTGSVRSADTRNAVLARVGRITAATFA